jgi:hypothetical protein
MPDLRRSPNGNRYGYVPTLVQTVNIIRSIEQAVAEVGSTPTLQFNLGPVKRQHSRQVRPLYVERRMALQRSRVAKICGACLHNLFMASQLLRLTRVKKV